jgi:GT2 family glycosyltransferase
MNPLVYIIIPVHNRKFTTLKCLKTLQTNGDLERYTVLVIDDGSTDGTDQAIQVQHPSVNILYGDGNLWWGGAIKKGMEYAYAQGAEYLIWLNDDCYPTQGTIDGLIKCCQSYSKAIVGAQCLDPDTLKPSYGGILLQHCKIQSISAELGTFIECDALNGNLVCLPRSIVNTIGYPDFSNFPHHYNDFVYTHKAQKKGYKLFISHQSKVYCKNELFRTSWLTSSNIALVEVCKDYFNKTSYYYWRIGLKVYQSFFGGLGIFIYVYDRIIKFGFAFLIVSILPLSLRQDLKIKK